MADFLSLDGRCAVVTGAARGIGRAIAMELAQRGAQVVVNYHTSQAEAAEVVSAIQQAGGQAVAFQADVSQFQQSQALMDFAIETFGKIDILVNNAGITRDGLLLTMSEEDWDIVLATNLKGTFHCCKAVIRHMIRNRYGRIINITSIAGQMGNAGQVNYAASKGGVVALVRSLAAAWAPRVRVNAIAPGFFLTEQNRYLLTDEKTGELTPRGKAIIAHTPMNRFGTPEDLLGAVLWLLSPLSSFVTGAVIPIDGGFQAFSGV